MRALPFLLATVFSTLAGVACTQPQLVPAPTSDGYGPAGGESGSSTGSSSGASTPPPSTSSGGGSGSGGASGSGGGSRGGSSSGSTGGSGSGSGGSSGSGSSSGGWPGGDDAGTGGDAGSGGGHDGGTGTGSSDGGGAAGSALLALCVSQINEFRNQNQEVPLTEAPDLEQYAAAASASDAHNGQAHSYFYATNGGGVATTEDELDGAKLEPGATAEQTMEQGLLEDEQANGNAAANLLDQQFSQVGCGFAQDLSGNWWVDIALQ